MPTTAAAYLAAAGATIWVRTDTTPPLRPEGFLIRVRGVILRRTGMVLTTWRGMYASGVGIGMQSRRIRRAVHIWAEPIHAGLLSGHWATVCCAAAVRCRTPTKRGAPTAASTSARAAQPVLGFVV